MEDGVLRIHNAESLVLRYWSPEPRYKKIPVPSPLSTSHPIIAITILCILNCELCNQSNPQVLIRWRKGKSENFNTVIPLSLGFTRSLEG